ncbi:MAG: YfhO family protein [Saprospiraceae bacterium]
MQAQSTFQRIWPTALAVLLMLVTCMAYFSPQLEGKAVPSGDVISNKGMAKELQTYEDETGNRALWTNSMFGGMPAYQIYASDKGNLLRHVENIIHLGIARPIGYFFALMLGMFLLLRVMGVNNWLSLIGAITFGLSANHMTLFEAGHMTKLRAISYMAPTLAGLILLFRGRTWSGLGLFGLALGLNIFANHPQMTYYLAVACGCFVIFRFITDMGEGQLPRFGKALGLALLAAGLAVGASYSKLSTTIEYGKDTMRGTPILEAAPGAAVTSSSEVDGLEWEYAMQWSNGLIDVFASFVPGAAGGSGQETVPKDGAFATAMKKKGAQLPREIKLPLYHGALPFTSGPAYFGVIAVWLFILAMFWLRPGWRYFLGSAVIITLLLSMGKNAEWFNRPLFNFIPYFSSFRAPSSATSVSAFLVVAGGFAALWQALSTRDEENSLVTLQTFYIGTGITAGLLLLLGFGGSLFTDFVNAGDSRLESAGYPMDAVYDERIAFMRSSALRGLGFVVIAAALLWAWLTKKIGMTPVIVAIGILSIFDIWSVGKRYLNSDDFKPKRQIAAAFAPRKVDQQILADTDLSYRVIDMTVNTFNDASVSYFHKSIGGYHAAKLQRADDLNMRQISQGNQEVLDMLNTRYIIGGQPGQEQVQRNPGALGNAWFVKTAQMVPSANAEFDALRGFQPATTAIVHQEFDSKLSKKSFSGSGTIDLTAYVPDRLTYKSSSTENQLAVFSEIWYGPDKGWLVTIDGQPAELIRVNYALRALEVPAGEHEIVMSFEPASFYRGEKISYASSGLILLLAGASLLYAFRQNKPSE